MMTDDQRSARAPHEIRGMSPAPRAYLFVALVSAPPPVPPPWRCAGRMAGSVPRRCSAPWKRPGSIRSSKSVADARPGTDG